MKDNNDKMKDKEPDSAAENGDAAVGELITVKASEYQKALTEAAEYKDRWVRALADFENFRKRYERERKDLIKYANQELIVDFLGVMDDLERAVEAANAKHEDYTAFLKGIEMVMARIYDLLKKNDVKAVEAVGKKFDPHCHEILMQLPSDQHADGQVLEEFQKGYYLGDRVVRTAKVKVAVNRAPEGDTTDRETDIEV